MLWPVQNDTGRRVYYCGPAAVSALTGTPLTRVEKMIFRVRDDWWRSQRRKPSKRRRPFPKSTSTYEVTAVLERLGCKVTDYPTTDLKTLGQFVDDTQHMPGAFLVNVTKHWVAVSSGHVAETIGGGVVKWVETDRRKVKSAYRVFAPETPRQPTGIAKRTRTPKTPEQVSERRDATVLKRAKAVRLQVTEWEARIKRAQTALKKLRPRLRRYQKLGLVA